MSETNESLTDWNPKFRPPSILSLRVHVPRTGLKSLKAIHWKIINAYAQGYKRKDIATALGVTPVTVTNTIKDPLVIPILQQSFAYAEQEIDSLLPLAIEGVRSNLKEGDLDQKRRAAETVFKVRGMYDKKADPSDTAEDVMQRVLTQIQLTVNVNQGSGNG